MHFIEIFFLASAIVNVHIHMRMSILLDDITEFSDAWIVLCMTTYCLFLYISAATKYFTDFSPTF